VRLQRRKPMQPDDFLLRELQRSRGGSMRDIVETIRRDQMELVTGAPSDILVIQGGPGTGKSAVGLHRVTWLVNNDHFKAVDILVIGPHQRFLDYVGRVLPTLGTRDVNAVQLGRLWDGEISGTDSPRGRLVKSDERMAAVLRRRVEHDHRPEALDDLTVPPAYEGDEPAVVITAGSTTLRVPRSTVVDLLTQASDSGAPYRERRDRFRGLLVDRLLQELADIAPRRGQTGTIRRDLERNRRVERLVDRVWPSPGPREALRSLYDSASLLAECAEGILDEGEQQALLRSRAASADGDRWTLDDQVCLEELRALITGETPRRYGHIVVDEAQDLTPMQARALRRRCAAGGSMTVLGDLAQATGPHTPASWDRIGTALSDQGDWRVAELTTSYRVPAEIMEFVAPLAHAVAPSVASPRAVREVGAEAVRMVPTEPWKLLSDAVEHVTRLSGSSDGSTLRSIAVIVPDDVGWLDEISRRIDESGAVAESGREHVAVLAASQSKGMEYDHVLVVEPATIADRGPSGLRQLYVALTRSTQSVTVLHTAPLPGALTPGDDESADQRPVRPADEPVAELPRIGTDVRVEVVDRAPGGRYKVRPLAPAIDRSLVLAVRHGSAAPRKGDRLDCWVFANETTQTVLTADRRGRSPVSERMAGRYVAALDVLNELAEHNGEVPDARARLSELQSMANRVLRRDQADWVDVFHLFGDPGREHVTELRDLASATGRALKDATLDHSALRDELEASGWAPLLAAARADLLGRQYAEPSDAEPSDAEAPDTAARTAADDDEPPRGEEASTPAGPPTGGPGPTEQKEEAVTESQETTTDAATPVPESLLRELGEAAAADRTCRRHEAVRHALTASLYFSDLQPVDSPVIDVSCVSASGLVLYEVMAAGRTSYTDLRSGAVRLREINHTLPAAAEALYLVLPEPPYRELGCGDRARGPRRPRHLAHPAGLGRPGAGGARRYHRLTRRRGRRADAALGGRAYRAIHDDERRWWPRSRRTAGVRGAGGGRRRACAGGPAVAARCLQGTRAAGRLAEGVGSQRRPAPMDARGPRRPLRRVRPALPAGVGGRRRGLGPGGRAGPRGARAGSAADRGQGRGAQPCPRASLGVARGVSLLRPGALVTEAVAGPRGGPAPPDRGSGGAGAGHAGVAPRRRVANSA
ncbi:ATP-binding domain-containing protein, partial [Streptomyces lonarensis]